MPDFSTNMPTIEYNPMGGLQTLQGVLGIQARRLDIQLGQQQLQTDTANAQQAQQQMQERQFYQRALASGKDERGDSLLSDQPDPVTGKQEPDYQKVAAFATRTMPLTGQQVSQALIKTHSDFVALDKSVGDLQGQYRDDISGIVRSHIGDKNATTASISAELEAYSKSQGNNPQVQAAVRNAKSLLGDHFDNISGLPTPNGPNQVSPRDDFLNRLSQRLQPPATTAAATSPAISMVQGPNGLAPINVNPNAPGGAGAQVGPAVRQGVGPQNIALPNNQVAVLDPATQTYRVYAAGGQAPGAGNAPPAAPPAGPARNAPPTAPGALPSPARPGGNAVPLTADNDPQKPGPNDPAWRHQSYGNSVDRAQKDVHDAQDADAGYSTNMQTADVIRRLSNDTNTGPGTTQWTHTVGAIGTRLGAQNVATTQELVSFLDLQASRLRDQMHLPATNAGLATSQEMGTSIESQRAAIQAKTDYYQALTELNHRYRLGLDAAGNGGVNPSPSSVAKFKSDFQKNADPIAMEIKLAQDRGDTAAAQRVLNGLSPQQRAVVAQHGRYLEQLPQ
jgi:hypothetical protein